MSAAPASAPPSSSAPASALPSAAPPPAACPFDRGLTGRIGPANVFVRLARSGDDLAGTYFYEKVGADLALQGSVKGASFTLTERAGGKTTGTLAGACEADGTARGTWSSPDGKRTLPFSFSVPAAITVGTRKLRISARSKDQDGLGDCSYHRATPVIFGAPSAAVEKRMEESVARAAAGISDPADERAARACRATEESGRLADFDGGFTVASQDANLLVMRFSAAVNYIPSAHPENFAGATVLNLDLATGKAVTVAEVVTDVKRLLDMAQGCADTGVDLASADPAYLFRPRGIQVVGTSYGHAMNIATFQGPEVSYAALLRDGLLVRASPIARVWAGETPAAAGASPCRVRWTNLTDAP